jgi:uncharacterized protein YlaI
LRGLLAQPQRGKPNNYSLESKRIMNKPRILVKCWECASPVKITRKRLASVGRYPKCEKHEKEFLAYVGNLYRQQN